MIRRLAPVIAAVTLGAVACASPGPGPEFEPFVSIELPQPDAVDAVVFLVGDAGATNAGRTPLVERLRNEVELWSETLGRDSAVTVVFLGDNVYEVGVRDRDHPEFAQDSARLWSQISIVAGEQARLRGSRGVFLAGNHDWGNMVGERGVARLRNQEAMIHSAASQGIDVQLLPEAGEPGPVVEDVRANVRLMFLDTHWFLQAPDQTLRTTFFDDVMTAMSDAEGRHVIMLAHHPWGSAGPHGLLAPGARALGLLFLMKKSGTLVQDLNSSVYAGFLAQMRLVFRRVGRSPLVFAAGHDHSLQVLDAAQPEGPETVLVSGAGSKLTDLVESDFLRYAAARPGYMVLIFRENDAVDLYVVAGDASQMSCPAEPEEDRVACMDEGVAAFQIVYSERLTPERSLTDTAAMTHTLRHPR